MKKTTTAVPVRMILTLTVLLLVVVSGDFQAATAEQFTSVEGKWVMVPASQTISSVTIMRQGDSYNVVLDYKSNIKPKLWAGLYQGSATEIIRYVTLPFETFAEGFSGSIAGELAGKVTFRYRFTLSADGRSMEFAQDDVMVYERGGRLDHYKIMPWAHKSTCIRVSEPVQVEGRGDRAYQADCGVVDPNRTEPFPPNHEFCPGNLVCMTNFCGGGMGCPYVCCPRGLPYLNHCDCKCYANSNFDCHSYSYCREKLLK